MRRPLKHLFGLFCLLFLFSCGGDPGHQVSLVTYNMYIGLDIEQKLAEFEQSGDLIGVAQEILSDFQASNPEERIGLAAAELAASKPDFIALQEAISFTVSPIFAVDFLPLLIQAIRDAGGPEYQAVSVTNLQLEEQVDVGGLLPINIRFIDREVILYRKHFVLEGQPLQQNLAAHRDPVSYDGKQIIFYRSLLGGRFRRSSGQLHSLFSTHLDQASLPAVQKGQAEEVLTLLLPYMDDDNLMLTGDFNTYEGQAHYALFTEAGFSDSYRLINPDQAGPTCCNLPDLSNLEPVADRRIDLIFFRSLNWSPLQSDIMFNQRSSTWVSDHFGVYSLLTEAQELDG